MEQREALVREILPEILQHVDLRDVFKLENLNYVKIGKLGDNNFMLSTLYPCTVVFTEGKELKLIVKQLDQDEMVQKMLGMDIMFLNEYAAYNGVLQLLGVTETFPKCYYSRIGEHPVIVMQDITELGFRMADSMTWLSKEHILLAVRALGKFHGKTFTLKEKDRAEFERVCGLFVECRYRQEAMKEGGIDLVFDKCAERGLMRFQEEISGGDKGKEEFYEEVKNLFSDPMGYAVELIKPRGPLSVLCHGDYTRNNVMYAYDELENPTKLMMLDLQTFRWASPATDLSVMLFLHYQASKLMTEWDEIFGEYHKALIKELCAGLDVSEDELPEFYSLTSMGRDFSEFSLHGYFTASYFLCFLHDPLDGDPTEFFGPDSDPEFVLHETMTRGGLAVTQALSDMLQLVYKLQKQYGYRKT